MIKYAIKKILRTKIRSFFFISAFLAVSLLFIYTFCDLEIGKEQKIGDIEEMSKNIALIEEFQVGNKHNRLKNRYQKVEYITTGAILISQNILIDIITPGLLDIGFPIYSGIHSGKFNIDQIELLYGSLSNINNVEFPIIIDDISSLRKFQILNSVGEKIVTTIDDQKITFEVIGVIKETKERLDRLAHGAASGNNSETYETSLGYSKAYILEETYRSITDSEPDYGLVMVQSHEDFNEESLRELLTLLDYDLNSLPYVSYVYTHLLYYNQIMKQYEDSILSNIIILGVIGIVFLLIYINGIFHGLSKDKEDISYYKMIGLRKKAISKLNISYWLVQLLIGVTTGIVGSFTWLYLLYGAMLFEYIFIYLSVLLIVLGSSILITLAIVLPATLVFVNKLRAEVSSESV